MHLCCFPLITSEIFHPTNRYVYEFLREVILSTEEIIQRTTLGIPKGMKKTGISISVVLSMAFWSEMKIQFPRNAKEKQFETILNEE